MKLGELQYNVIFSRFLNPNDNWEPIGNDRFRALRGPACMSGMTRVAAREPLGPRENLMK